MRKTNQRILIPLATVLIGSALGAAAGYVLGQELALREAQMRLSSNAASAIDSVEAYASEAHQLLSAMNTSTYAFCSEPELAYFRRLIYQSNFLKEAGHMREGSVACSAIVGSSALSRASVQPEVIEQDGSKLYFDMPAFRVGRERMVALQAGGSYVVADLRLHGEAIPASVHIDVHMLGANTLHIGAASRTASEAPVAQNAGVHAASDGTAVVGDTLYATRCSSRYPGCVTASLSTTDALRIERTSILTVVVLCALAGSAFGLIWSFVRNRNRSLERQLRRALAKNQLDVVYQPVVDMTSGRMVGAEALARWKCDTGLPVSPDVFVRIAEQRGFVGEITRCVVNRALDEFAPVIRRNPQFRLAVNVAAADMSDAAFLPMLAAALERTGVARRNVVIELTETCTAQREEAIETIRLLRQAGHQVHIDDFGTGYSSLSYLKDLAVDAIKIDQSFTQAIGTESVTVAILPQILAIAEALNVDVTVEGVETARQAAYFMNSRVPIFAQGWLFGRPAPIEEFVCMLNASTAKAEREWAAEDETEFALPVGAM